MDDRLDQQLRFLPAAHTSEMAHSERGLLDHLLGARQLLVDWGMCAAVCDAGLFHSIYGTEHYLPSAVPLEKRAEVRQLIGEEAERLAWLFSVMNRDSFVANLQRSSDFAVENRLTREQLPLGDGQFQDLVTLTFANTLEALPRLSWNNRRACRAYLRRFRARGIHAAQQAFDRAWEVWK